MRDLIGRAILGLLDLPLADERLLCYTTCNVSQVDGYAFAFGDTVSQTSVLFFARTNVVSARIWGSINGYTTSAKCMEEDDHDNHEKWDAT